MIRVLVAEDSVTTREFLVAVLDSDPDVEVVGQAKDGVEAVEMTLRLRPDVVTMDVEMPRLGGFEATKEIMIECPTPVVIVSATVDGRGVEKSMHALRAGALTVLPKPSGPGSPRFETEAGDVVRTVKLMSQVKVVRHWPEERFRGRSLRSRGVQGGEPARIVAVAASTGGPQALAQLLGDLPGDLPAPILVVQHIAVGFVAGLATWLNLSTRLRVKIAENGEPLSPRTAYLAPDECHLGVANGETIGLFQEPPVNGFRPSGTFLFNSVARVFGPGTVALVLTGMGNDGAAGLQAVRDGGGRILAQDEQSSVIYGMPAAAAATGLAHGVLPLSAMAGQLAELVVPGRRIG